MDQKRILMVSKGISDTLWTGGPRMVKTGAAREWETSTFGVMGAYPSEVYYLSAIAVGYAV